jgi:hypothetical protein
MGKVPTFVSGKALVEALERVRDIMQKEVDKYPDLLYELAVGGLSSPPLAVILMFNPETLKLKKTKICSEKRAAQEWNKANGNRFDKIPRFSL